MKELTIIKIGGNIIDNEKALKKFLKDLSAITTPIILVHGGGKLATQISGQLGIQTQLVDGRRITDSETLKVATMVYAGWINKNITAQLNANKKLAMGLCGADAFLIPAVNRKKGKINYGFVGDVLSDQIKTELLKDLLKKRITPVIAPITATTKGQLLNTNADTIASSLAVALSKVYKIKLIYCFEKQGVLHDEKLIKEINSFSYQHLIAKQIVTDGMIPKLDNAFDALNNGVNKVTIGNANKIKQLIQSHAGTNITIH